jgi:hypothetical protein
LRLFKVLVLDLLEDNRAVEVDPDRLEGCQSRGQLFILYVSGVDRSILEIVPLHQGGVILGMDWLGKYRAQMECFAKTVTFSGSMGERVVFRGERNVIPNCLISAMTTQKIMRKGCEVYLALVVDVHGRK